MGAEEAIVGYLVVPFLAPPIGRRRACCPSTPSSLVLAAQSDEVSTLEESGINIGARHFDIIFFLCDDLKSAMIINSLYGTSAMHNCAHCDATKTQIKSGQTGQLRTLASHTVHVKRVRVQHMEYH
jgi:hypothetical protein